MLLREISTHDLITVLDPRPWVSVGNFLKKNYNNYHTYKYKDINIKIIKL